MPNTRQSTSCITSTLLLVCIVLLCPLHAQNLDAWSGDYKLYSPKGQAFDSIRIDKIEYIDAESQPTRLRWDLNRWNIYALKKKSTQQKKEVIRVARKFIYDHKSNDNEYEQFGWTQHYLEKKISCLDAGHFFICKTKPKQPIKIGNEEFFTETGLFGILLHYGFFNLEKI